MKKYLKYILLFLILKPIITVVGYPSDTYTTITTYRDRTPLEKKLKVAKRLGDQIKETSEIKDGVEDFNFHINNYFEYHNEAFAYSFILTLLVFLFLDKKNMKSLN